MPDSSSIEKNPDKSDSIARESLAGIRSPRVADLHVIVGVVMPPHLGPQVHGLNSASNSCCAVWATSSRSGRSGHRRPGALRRGFWGA